MIEEHPQNLSKLQTTFKKLVWDGKEHNPKQSPAYLKESAPIDWKTRVGVYQYAVKARIVESLDDDYETLKKVMGDKEFRKMTLAYLVAFPSKYASLAEVSKDIPQFLKTYSGTSDRKYLSELADMEWRLLKASLSENLSLNNLADLQNEGNVGKDILFVLHNSVELLHYLFPIQKFFEGIEKELSPESTRLVLFQRGKKGAYEKIEEVEFLLLEQVKLGKSLSQLNEYIFENKMESENLGQFFSKWSVNAWIAGFKTV